MGGLTWNVDVDWDNNATIDGGDEAPYMVDINIKRGRRNMIRADGRGFEGIPAGVCKMTFDNTTGRFDPWNSDSALYPNIRRGRLLRVQATDNDTSTTTTEFTGFIRDIVPKEGKEPRVVITAYDGIQKLEAAKVTEYIRNDQNADDLFGYILTAVSWTGGASVENDDDAVPYWWPDTEKRAWEMLTEMAQAWMGVCFIAVNGQFWFYARQHSEAASATVTQSELLKTIQTPLPWDTVWNNIAVYANPRRVYSDQEIWRLTDIPLIPAGESRDYFCEYTYNGQAVPAQNVRDMVATDDYTFNAQENGGGADLTANLTPTLTKYGRFTYLVLENTGGTDGYVTLAKIRGDPLVKNATRIERNDTTSQTDYGTTSLVLDYDWLQNADNAEDFADFLKGVLSEPQPFPVVEVEARPSLQFGNELFDKWALTIAKKGIAGDFDIGGYEHQSLGEHCNACRSTFWLEPSLDDRYWILTAVVGTSTIVGF